MESGVVELNFIHPPLLGNGLDGIVAEELLWGVGGELLDPIPLLSHLGVGVVS